MSEQKKDVKDESEHITLRVIGSEGSTVQFKIKRSTPSRKLKKAYCDKQKLTVLILLIGSQFIRIHTPVHSLWSSL
ncbi:small ubiquitin-related modifier 3-like isoform X2 [Apostichopus japonicus]|uniref:small ubiquitin-related modifier 3-like isoform X2 n=1 Tax=Stichopus japonicus TaxID=307972 RepID=UPI003AB6B3A1